MLFTRSPRAIKTVLLSLILISGFIGYDLVKDPSPKWKAAVLAQTVPQITFPELVANNVVVHNGIAYATLGTGGVGIVDLAINRVVTQLPPAGSSSVDDLSVADGLLFTLDATSPGFLSVLTLEDPLAPRLVSGPIQVPVGPFSGVSAAAGKVIVSGGTSLLTVRTYDVNGQLGNSVSSIDLGVGQPDVVISDDGGHAFVSTDFAGGVDGSSFGLTVIRLEDPPTSPTVLDRLGLPGAGFTPGGVGPANFAVESAMMQNLLLVGFGGGLAVIDAGDLEALQLLTVVNLGLSAVNVDAVGQRAFVVGSAPQPALVVVDLTDPSVPVIVETVPLPGESRPSGVAKAGHTVVIAANAGGLIVLTSDEGE